MKTKSLKQNEAKQLAARIAKECSECFSHVVARKFMGSWQVDINGGSGACYGKTVDSQEDAEDLIRIFKND